jgi:Mg2+-importing ATPase
VSWRRPVPARQGRAGPPSPPADTDRDLRWAALQTGPEVLRALGSGPAGLTVDEAGRRLREQGPNAVRGHRARPLRVVAIGTRSRVRPRYVQKRH